MTENTELALQEQEEALAGLAKRTAKTKREQPRVGMLPFMKMGKDGIWVYGQQNTEVQPESLWAIDPFSYQFGYTCWTDHPDDSGKKNVNMGKEVVALGADPINPTTLSEYIDPDSGVTWKWSPVIEVELKCVTGEDKGVTTVYQVSSIGGLRIGSEYLDLLAVNIANKVPVAVVELKFDTYTHNQWGKTYVPEWEYHRWLALNDTELGGEPVAAIEKPAEEPSAEARAQAEMAAAEAVPEEKPKGRRRPAANKGDAADGGASTPAPAGRRRPAA